MAGDQMPQVGERWLTRDGLPLSHRVVTVDAVAPGEHNIDKGPTAAPPDDDVVFRFVDSGCPSRCGLTAFRRTYVLEAEVLARAR